MGMGMGLMTREWEVPLEWNSCRNPMGVRVAFGYGPIRMEFLYESHGSEISFWATMGMGLLTWEWEWYIVCKEVHFFAYQTAVTDEQRIVY